MTPNRVRKSLGAETTFLDDLDNLEELGEELKGVRDEVWARAKRHEFYGKTVVLKVKFDDFHQITRSKTLLTAIESYDTLQTVSNELLESIYLNNRRVRLIGLTIGNTPEPCAESIQLRFDFDKL